MSKQRLNESMSSLMAGLVGNDTDVKQQDSSKINSENTVNEKEKSSTLRSKKTETEQISTVVNKVDMDKLRTVCLLEGYSIKDVIGAGISNFLKKYEEKYGPIRVKTKKSNRIDDIISSL